MKRNPGPIVFPEKNKAGESIWTCSECGRKGRWSDEWRYYGPMDEPIFVACSETCRDTLSEKQKIETTEIIVKDKPRTTRKKKETESE